MLNSLLFLLECFDYQSHPRLTTSEWLEHRELLGFAQSQNWLSQKSKTEIGDLCRFCEEGVLAIVGDRVICPKCFTYFKKQELFNWELSRQTFLEWVSLGLGFQATYQRIGDQLLLIGNRPIATGVEWLYYQIGTRLDLTETKRLNASQSSWVLWGTQAPEGLPHIRSIALWDQFYFDQGTLKLRSLGSDRVGTSVRFDLQTGELWIGQDRVGEVSFASREYYFLKTLWESQDRFVSYHELKQKVTEATGTTDERDSATYCQRLKHLTKAKIPQIDLILVTSGKGQGYRFRSRITLP